MSASVGCGRCPETSVILTCTDCGLSFEPSVEDFAAGRTGCPDPDCDGWTFWAELREPAKPRLVSER